MSSQWLCAELSFLALTMLIQEEVIRSSLFPKFRLRFELILTFEEKHILPQHKTFVKAVLGNV